MFAVKIDANDYVEEFAYCTLAQFAQNPLYKTLSGTDQTQWFFIDRTNFWSKDEVVTFVRNPYNYYYDPTQGIIRKDYTKTFI